MYSESLRENSVTKNYSYEELCDIIDAYHIEYRFYAKLLQIFCKNHRKLNKNKPPENTIIYYKIRDILFQLEEDSNFFIWKLNEKTKEVSK